MKFQEEFDRQVQNLLIKGYPKLANFTEEEFKKLLEPLRDKVSEIDATAVDLEKGHMPFVIVIKSDLIPAEKLMSIVEKGGKEGITKLYPHSSEDFEIINDIKIPEGNAYLMLDIDRGKENINLAPRDAMEIIQKDNRSPLTIDEGIAIVTQFPEFLIKNNCFSLLASRHPGDQRVPAIWINANKNPNLGWCWEGNPHTWLGSASCIKRVD